MLVDDGFVTTLRKSSVTVDVREIPPSSPSDEKNEYQLLSRCFKMAKGTAEAASRNADREPLQAVGVEDMEHCFRLREIPGWGKTRGSSSLVHRNVGQQVVPEQKKVKMQLPSFSSLGINSLVAKDIRHDLAEEVLVTPPHKRARLQSSQSWPTFAANAEPQGRIIGVVPLLTPPEESDTFKWTTEGEKRRPSGFVSSSVNQEESHHSTTSHAQSTLLSSNRPTTIPIPAYNMESDNTGSPSWLKRATDTIVSCQSDSLKDGQIQMVVQALPSQGKIPHTKPVFEEVAEYLQQQSSNAPYITITHAVSQVVSMLEVPASPPATPNNLNTSDDYFDNQTIFTHAATVPSYHTPSAPAPSSPSRVANIITAPASIHVSTLERYIPPTTAEEVRDFFSISRRSYLVDRLTELSAKNGTLLLVYPTLAGATTFVRSYIGPVLDPFLRQFILLNNLTTDAAVRLGKSAALPAMTDFDTMSTSLRTLCQNLTERAPAGRGARSGYSVIHAEAVEVSLERANWVEWFIEQETARLRQDMIDYQKSGGRMPARGFDCTPGSLAREVIEGIRNSKETAGGSGIEVCVFVIRRSLL